MTPRMPGCSASHSISATDRSTPWVIGTSAMPPWRSGLRLHISARKRLWARAPAKASSGSVIAPGGEAGAERRRGHAGDGVGVGEHDLGGHTVGVELLVALFDVPRAAQAFFVLGLPPHDVVVVHLQGLVAVGLALGQVLVELRRGTSASR